MLEFTFSTPGPFPLKSIIRLIYLISLWELGKGALMLVSGIRAILLHLILVSCHYFLVSESGKAAHLFFM